MQIEQPNSSICEEHAQPEGAPTSDGNASEPASSCDNAVVQQPAKRPTRQWAAWTREEEESFFTALRQVGKNFEKITCRVQSKNKDQVRHYYYRLVRRMNKLLGPRLCLDAKNSKDTNAAMLRWWSLLEKYSFKASKLHLKPRRFKIFVEALEHQLLKDRKKNVRKRSNGENSFPSLCTPSNQSRPSAHDNHTVKMVLVDSQNIQKLGPGKPSFKRSVSLGTTRGNNKGEPTSVKQPRQRRKPGIISPTAYKKWEKAAIAGVSLVADAAEHVERTTSDAAEHIKFTADAAKHVKRSSAGAAEHLNCTAVDPAQRVVSTAADKDIRTGQDTPGLKGSDPGGGFLPPLAPLSQNHLIGGVQTCTKLKLQLFPIDDCTRRALEMDKHNPHLELTLSTRKKISSVLEHMNRKWGGSTVARGELMLFPYGIQQEKLISCTKWTQESTCSAAEVYAIIGSPPVFRLWYGWITNSAAPVGCCFPGNNSPVDNNCFKKVGDIYGEQLLSATKDSSAVRVSDNIRGQINSYAVEAAVIPCHEKETWDENIKQNDGDVPRPASKAALSAGEWADSLTNVSVGDLLLEVAQSEEVNDAETSIPKAPQCAQHFSISCDSFDAAVAAHMSKYQDKVAFQSTFSSHVSSSIWDAEVTCDAFSFRKSTAAHKEAPYGNISSGDAGVSGRTNPAGSDGFIEEREVETAVRSPPHDDPTEEYLSDDQIVVENPTKDFSGLADIYWPESLGPLDMDIPAPTYRSEDLILSDSLSCLNRLIASSLDAFQNCSFFGTDKKEPDPTAVEARENAPFSISSGV